MSQADPEEYSLALDLTIIGAIFTTIALLFGGLAYLGLAAWNAASETIADVADSSPKKRDEQSDPNLAEALSEQIQEKLEQFERARTSPNPRLELVDTARNRLGFVIYGRLVNPGPVAIGPPEIEFRVLDEAGESLEVEWVKPNWLGLGPKESRPVELTLKAPKKSSAIAVGQVRAEEIDLPESVAGLRVTLTQNLKRRNRRVFRGVVTNGGERTAHHVEIDVVGYDKGTKSIMGVATARVRKPIPPGEEVRFETELAEFIGTPDEFSPIARALSAPYASP